MESSSSNDRRAALRLHLKEPDFSRPVLQLTPEQKRPIFEKLEILYGPDGAAGCYAEVERIMQVYYAYKPVDLIEDDARFNPFDRFTEHDVVAITYGDLIENPAKRPLRTLADFVTRFLSGSVNTVHLLPFFPSSSDRGFSIIDYKEVSPELGTWEEIEELGLRFRLMFDGVINHISSKSDWFQEFLNGNPDYQDFFLAFESADSVSEENMRLILRPRTTKLLTRFQTLRGERHLWTTFSADQIDLNFRNSTVLLRVLEVLLYYVRRGADIIRLDAATYLWRELGTTCAHLEQTHALVQLFRAVLDVVAPQVAVLTETNVPHEDNISYFGDGTNEAHMVYNFALPPLTLRAMRTGNCRRLAEWAGSLEYISDTATYFNFLDSHDGIGLLGARAFLPPEEIDDMVRRTLNHGGRVSYRTAPDGSQSPYELNITWFDALNKPGSDDPVDLQVQRFVASRSIALVLMGVPGIYLPSFCGSQFELGALPPEAEARAINRRAISERVLLEKLQNPRAAASKIARKMIRMVRQRVNTPAFHPNGRQKVLTGNDGVFAVLRESPNGQQIVLALTNVTGEPQEFRCDRADLGTRVSRWMDLLSRRKHAIALDCPRLTVPPYGVMWLTPFTENR
jgi:sucrose phosphorylase